MDRLKKKKKKVVENYHKVPLGKTLNDRAGI